MQLDLDDRIALVTGASKGIGPRRGPDAARRGSPRRRRVAQAAAGARPRSPSTCIHHAVDLIDPDGARTRRGSSRPTRSAGSTSSSTTPAARRPDTKLPRLRFPRARRRPTRVRCSSSTCSRRCARRRAAIPVLFERGGGAIVNVSSVHGRQPSAINVDYGAAKAAMINLTKALSDEFAPQGVRVNGVCPGPVKTPWWTDDGRRRRHPRRARPELRSRERHHHARPGDDAARHRSARRAAGRSPYAVAFLASPCSESTSGAEFVVDSGMLKAS